MSCSILALAGVAIGLSLPGAVTANPTCTLTDKTGVVLKEIAPGVMLHLAEVQVDWNTGCGGAEESSHSYSLRRTSGGSIEDQYGNVGGPNQNGSDVYDAPPGSAYYVEFSARCCRDCNTLGVESASKSITSNLIVIRAQLGKPIVMTESPPAFYPCLPTGVQVKAAPVFEGQAASEGEGWTVVFKGAGLDYRKTFMDGALSDESPTFTVPESGEVEHYIIHEPHGVESNHLTLRAEPGGCVTNPGSPDAGVPGDDEAPEPNGGSSDSGDKSGCTAAGAGAAALFALVPLVPALLRRRRS